VGKTRDVVVPIRIFDSKGGAILEQGGGEIEILVIWALQWRVVLGNGNKWEGPLGEGEPHRWILLPIEIMRVLPFERDFWRCVRWGREVKNSKKGRREGVNAVRRPIPSWGGARV